MNVKKRNIVIIPSEGGYKNIGDEAMFISMVEILKEKIIDIEVIALTPNPEKTVMINGVKYKYSLQPYLYKRSKFWGILSYCCHSRLINNIPYFLNSFAVILNALFFRYFGKCFIKNTVVTNFFNILNQADIIINSGGGNLNDIWTYHELYPRCITIIIANILQKNVVVTGQGIGPLNNHFARKFLAFSLNKTKLITLRDFEASEAILKKIGVDVPKIQSVGDDAIFLSSSLSKRVEGIIKKDIENSSLKIGIHFRLADYAKTDAEIIPMIARLIDRLVEEYDARIVFIPMAYSKTEDDREALLNIYKNVKYKKNVVIINAQLDVHETKAVIGRMDYVIGLSYHFIFFALINNVPAIALYNNEYYKQKLIGLLRFYNMDDKVVQLNELDIERIPKMLNDLMQKRAGIALDLENETMNMENRVMQTIKYIETMLMKQCKNN